ncbi:MAG: general secretion pathway protein [Betaproteobacteria bacterium]|nr:MAG: general secretion pathway protein [Betaproteobacteria bacterium]
MREFLIGRSTLLQAALLSALTLAAVALLGLVLAYWTWIWFAPRAEQRTESVAAASGTVAAAGALFGSPPRAQGAAAPTGIAITLLGIVAASGGRRGHAVVQLDGKQILAVNEGEDVAPGVRLAEVHSGHVVLMRGGARETLTWPKRRATAAPVARTLNK